ncbi:uncharacterized protein V6R79_022236 [Siganus canaliculatus]
MTEKVAQELRTEETMVLCDAHGNKLVESSGTSGLAFWKQNTRKIVALTDSAYKDLQRRKKRRISVYEETTKEKLEDLFMAAEELPAVTETLRELVTYARSNKMATVALTEKDVTSVEATFKCVICRDPTRNPIVDPCCRSLISCRECIDEWAANEPSCPRCRDLDFATNRFEITGMEDTVKILRDSIRD